MKTETMSTIYKQCSWEVSLTPCELLWLELTRYKTKSVSPEGKQVILSLSKTTCEAGNLEHS